MKDEVLEDIISWVDRDWNGMKEDISPRVTNMNFGKSLASGVANKTARGLQGKMWKVLQVSIRYDS